MYDDFGFIFNKNAISSKMVGGLGFFNRKHLCFFKSTYDFFLMAIAEYLL